jgi:hypothetical protein
MIRPDSSFRWQIKQPHQEDDNLRAETSEVPLGLGVYWYGILPVWKMNFGQQVNILSKYLTTPHVRDIKNAAQIFSFL